MDTNLEEILLAIEDIRHEFERLIVERDRNLLERDKSEHARQTLVTICARLEMQLKAAEQRKP